MLSDKRFYFVLLLWPLFAAGGCASFQRPAAQTAMAEPTPEQREWWEANRSRSKYMAGRGFYVEGVSGFFDEKGRPISSSGPEPSFLTEDEEELDLIDAVSPSNSMKRFKKMIGRGPNEPIARQAFDEGEALFKQARYKEAAAKYTIAYDRWPDSPLEEQALFMSAECLFFADKCPKADDTYAMLVKKYPGTQYLDRVTSRRFAIARYWEGFSREHPHWPVTPNLLDKTRPLFDTAGHALRVYESVRLDDPTGPLADDSIMATANAYFVQGRYEDADYHYALIRTEYPKSEHQFQAHLLGLRAKLMSYQGPDYSGKPLDEADEVANQLLTQFPNELGTERERVVQSRGEIRANKALREFQLAQFYDNGKYYGAARVHYENVAKQFPDTKMAETALARIEQVKGEPANPTPVFGWVEEVLPQSKKKGPTIATAPGNIQR